jgi:hypothetical protein
MACEGSCVSGVKLEGSRLAATLNRVHDQRILASEAPLGDAAVAGDGHQGEVQRRR